MKNEAQFERTHSLVNSTRSIPQIERITKNAIGARLRLAQLGTGWKFPILAFDYPNFASNF